MNKDVPKQVGPAPINFIPMVEGESIKIPLTRIIPSNHRLFIVTYVVPEKKLDSGLFLPETFTVKDRHSNNIAVQRLRYFVAAVSPDCLMPIKIGDEIYPLIYDGTTLIELPRIYDFMRNNQEFLVIHDTEIMGFKPSQTEEEDETKS